MKAVTVCVDYSDYLAVTLPRSAPFFDRVIVVTTPEDAATRAVVASVPNAACHLTRSMYDDGAHFNKGLVLEQAFDVMGRDGWFVVMDADVVMPSGFRWPSDLDPEKLYSPRRRMMVEVPWPLMIPPDHEWAERFPLHPQEVEFAGYFQLANASCRALARRPWYPTDWIHCGGCDSEFQARWSEGDKVRPNFEVLHLGPAGVNWLGRVSPSLSDGTVPPGAAVRLSELRRLRSLRRGEADRFRHEKLG
jgi:hypothetical protein